MVQLEKENYESWFMKMFLPATSPLRESAPVVLFFDSHHSHISISLDQLMLLPSNTTHILQPLDVGVYGPLKKAWKRILAEYKLKTRTGNIGKVEFPKLLQQLWGRSFKPEHLMGGFRESWPSLSCWSGPFCSVSKMFCYPLIICRHVEGAIVRKGHTCHVMIHCDGHLYANTVK